MFSHTSKAKQHVIHFHLLKWKVRLLFMMDSKCLLSPELPAEFVIEIRYPWNVLWDQADQI